MLRSTGIVDIDAVRGYGQGDDLDIPSREKRSGAMMLVAPLEQSKTTFIPLQSGLDVRRYFAQKKVPVNRAGIWAPGKPLQWLYPL